jgi:hypothetical protein
LLRDRIAAAIRSVTVNAHNVMGEILQELVALACFELMLQLP